MSVSDYALAGKDSEAPPEARLQYAMQEAGGGSRGGAILFQLQAQLLPGSALAERLPYQGARCEDGAVGHRCLVPRRPWIRTDMWTLTLVFLYLGLVTCERIQRLSGSR